MITLYTGTPGSGKSYTAADRIDRALKRGMPVIANFEININKRHKGEFVYVDTLELNPLFFMEYAEKHFDPKKGEGQGMIFIDEAQIPFNPRTGFGGKGVDRSRMAWINFFSKHRHYFWDVVLITQHDRMIDRQIRSLVEVERKHRDLKNFGIKGFYMMMIFRKRFVQVSYWYAIQEKIGSEFFRLSKRVCKLYNTFKKFENDKDNGADQSAQSDIKNKIAEFNAKKAGAIQ